MLAQILLQVQQATFDSGATGFMLLATSLILDK